MELVNLAAGVLNGEGDVVGVGLGGMMTAMMATLCREFERTLKMLLCFRRRLFIRLLYRTVVKLKCPAAACLLRAKRCAHRIGMCFSFYYLESMFGFKSQ